MEGDGKTTAGRPPSLSVFLPTHIHTPAASSALLAQRKCRKCSRVFSMLLLLVLPHTLFYIFFRNDRSYFLKNVLQLLAAAAADASASNNNKNNTKSRNNN